MAVALPVAGTKEDVWIPTACDQCYNACTVQVHRVDGVAVKVEGLPGVGPNYGATCAKGLSALMNVYSPNRVQAPMVRTNPEKGIGVDPGWKAISWDEAMDLLVEKIRTAREKDPRSIVGFTFDRFMIYFLRAFAAAIGSPNVGAGSAAYFCGNGSHPVAFTLTGSNDVHPDLHHCNHLVMFGTSYGFVAQMNAMGLATQMADARMRGMKLTVIDPVLSYAASQADEWIPIRPGTDTALALGLMREWVWELERFDRDFVRRYTNATYLVGPDGHYTRDPASGKPLVGTADGRTGAFDEVTWQDSVLEGSFEVGGVAARPGFEAFRDHLRPYTPERVFEITSVPPAAVRRLAREMVEAAQIGQTIELDGETLPLRPAAACWYRGISAHRHAMLNGMAIGQLDVLLGAVDVPGGLINAAGAGPGWMPTHDADGLLIAGNPFGTLMTGGLPKRRAKPPQTVALFELFPLSVYSETMLALGLLEGDRYGVPYETQVLIQCRGNIMTTGGDPEATAEALRRVPFIVSMSTFHDETNDFADLLLPDTHALERLSPMVSNPFYYYVSATVPFERYTWNFQQPIVKAVPQARHWGEVLLDVIHRLGLDADLNSAFNESVRLPAAYRLSRDEVYTWEQLADRWTRAICGDDHGLEYFYEHGYYQSDMVRGARISYPRAFHPGRIPLYLEHFIDAGETVREFVATRDVEWDTSDYIPLVEWKPCLTPSQAPPEFDLWVVNQKLPFMTFSHSAENPLLMDLAERNGKVFNIGINAGTATAKGIRDGDRIELESPEGKRASGVARLTEGVHPECLSVPGILGRWRAGDRRSIGKGVHFNSLLTYSIDHMDLLSAALDACVKVKVRRVD